MKSEFLRQFEKDLEKINDKLVLNGLVKVMENVDAAKKTSDIQN